MIAAVSIYTVLTGIADCFQLTDLSVFELASLQKLRRIGLVRVNNLTDEAIYALGDRHSTLERVHLSYCDQITVMAIHFLLQKLQKLNHLSLTGIPAFRRPELQQFCRSPPPVSLYMRSFVTKYYNCIVSHLIGVQLQSTSGILCLFWRRGAPITPLSRRSLQQHHR